MIKHYHSLFVFVLLTLSVTFAQPEAVVVENSQVEKLVKVLPDDVFVLVATGGADSLKPAFEKTILGKMWYDRGVQTFFEAVTKELIAKLKQEIQDSDSASAFDAAEDFVRLVLNRPIIIGAARKEVKDGPPIYGFAIVDAGPRKADIALALTKLEALANEGSIIEINVGPFKMHRPREADDVPGYWGWVGNHMVFAINDEEGLAIKHVQNLSTTSRAYFKRVSKPFDALAIYLDCKRITDVVSYVLLGQERDTKQLNIVAKVIKELGLDDIETLTARMGFAGPDVVSSELIEIPEPRTGLFSSLRTISLSMFDMVDAAAVNATAVNCDYAGVYDTVMRVVGIAVPSEGYAEIRHGITKFESEAKLNIRKELLESLAGPAVFYSIPAGMMVEVPSGGIVAIAKLKDAPLFEKTMIALGTFAAAKSKGMLQVSSQVQSDGRTLHSWAIAPLAMTQVLPGWAIVDDHVLIVSDPELYKTAIEQITSAGRGGESMRTTKGFIKATKRLPSNLVFLRYTDSKVQFKQMMSRLQQFWPMISMPAVKKGIRLPAVLPSVAHIVEDMESSCQYSWFDTEGLHLHYRGPGLEQGMGAVAGASIGAGIMMPALVRTRDQARRIASSSNLKQIGLICAMYAEDHQGYFPKDMQQLTEYFGGAERFRKVLESPRKPKGFEGPSYIYIAGQSANTKRAANYILVYENPAFCKGKINALFLDYSVRAMGQQEFLKALEATYKRLGREMPEVTFKDSQNIVISQELPTRSLKSTDKLDLSGTQTTDADLADRLEGLTSLRELNLSRTRITNEGLAHLRGLSSLRRLFLGNTQITDSGLTYLRNLISLRYLCFHGTQVGDTGLAHLKDLTSLQYLCLHDTQVSDDGLAHLRGLTSLRILHLRNTKISDAGLAHIKNLAGLQNLCVHKTQVSDTGLAYLKDLTSLQSLCLHDTHISDDGLAHLRGLTSLKTLYLHNTQVSDAGLVHLKGLTSLRQLNLSGTKVSSAGLAELEQTLPNCRISGPDAPVARRAESTLIDKPAPSFALQDLNGKQVNLSDFKGKVVLLDFWATWCGPCRQAIPHLEALHKKYKDQGLVLIGINNERDHDKVKEFAKEQISYVVLLDADEQFTEYGIRGIPTAFYIDREGKIRYRDVGFGSGKEKEIEQKVKELLADKEEIKLVTAWERQESRVPEKEEVAVLRKQKPPLSQRLNGNVLTYDNFDGKLNLKWDILNADLSHVSLTKNPGMLTITTQKGSLRGSNKNYKNLFLIDCPSRAGRDFRITTCLSSFKPVARYQQAGLICYNDDDNFLRFVYEWRPGQCSFNSNCEVDGRKTSTAISLIDEQLERIWLRVTKSGNWYTFSSSLDGKSFNERGAYAWGDGLVKRVGILATNGLPSKAPEIDASFDFFEVKAAPAKLVETKGAAAKFVVPSNNLRIPKELQACAGNLKKIYTAIKKYEKDKGELPDWLSDLVPMYLSSEMLLCPNDTMYKSPYSPDPKLPCSYSWQFSTKQIPPGWDPTGRTIYRDWKTQQVELFGDVVPKVRCHHHGNLCLNLSVGGQIWWGPRDWEYMFKPDYRFGEVVRPDRQIASPAKFTPWMSSADYQKEFQRRGKNRYYPVKIEGRSYKGENQYRAIFEPFLPGLLGFFSCHGLQGQLYIKKNKDCLSKDYKQIHLQTFEDYKGIKRYQATWICFGAESPRRQRRVIQPAGQLRITGVARDESGKPLVGVKLQVMPMSLGEVTSDSQGRFEVRWDPRRLGSRETLHYLVARLEERNLAVAVEINEEATTLDVILEPGVVFVGKVVDPDGKGIAGARVMMMLRVSNWGSGLGRGQVADVEGKFELRALPLGHKYSLIARAEGYGEKRIEVHTNDAVDNHLDVGRLTLAVADLSVSGLVVDADDKPVANARVFCYGEGQQTHSAQTDTDGKFTLDKICKGQIRITASISGTRRMYGYTQTEGGATDVKVVIGERPLATRYIPKRPSSLGGKSLPNQKDLETGLSPADANAKDEEGLTALHLAARQGRKDEVEQLLADGANVNSRLNRWPGWMPLHEAAAANHKDVAELLIDKGADVKADCARAGGGRFGGTALHEAVFEGHREMAELLISKGANINARQSGGLTPLDVAAFVGHKDVIELLIARGADLNIRDRGGRTALRWAKHGRHKEIVELLQKRGAKE